MRTFAEVSKEAFALKSEADTLHLRFIHLTEKPSDDDRATEEMGKINERMAVIATKMKALAFEARRIRERSSTPDLPDFDLIY